MLAIQHIGIFDAALTLLFLHVLEHFKTKLGLTYEKSLPKKKSDSAVALKDLNNHWPEKRESFFFQTLEYKLKLDLQSGATYKQTREVQVAKRNPFSGPWTCEHSHPNLPQTTCWNPCLYSCCFLHISP